MATGYEVKAFADLESIERRMRSIDETLAAALPALERIADALEQMAEVGHDAAHRLLDNPLQVKANGDRPGMTLIFGQSRPAFGPRE